MKEGIFFWDEDVFEENKENDCLQSELSEISTELMEISLSDDSKEVAVTVAGYIARNLKKNVSCKNCAQLLISDPNENQVEDD